MKAFNKFIALLCAAALFLSLTACGGKDDGTIAYVDGEQLIVAVAMQPESLNPAVSANALESELYLLCYDPLWRLDENGEPVACIAEDYSLSSDQLTWTIRLRHGVTFSDGTELTSEDVRFSYEMMQNYSEIYGGYFDGVTAIRCPDSYTVVISTSYVKGDMMYNPTPILPKHLWSGNEFSPAQFDNSAMIGTGPFIYDAAASGETGCVLRARADYFGGAAQVGSIFFENYGSDSSAARAIAAGEVDASFGLTDVQLTTLESVPGVELIQAMLPTAECRAIVFNTASSLFSNIAMRQMIEYSADRAWFLSMSSGGAGMTGSSVASPGTTYFAQPTGQRTYDHSAAAAQLLSMGYSDTDGDGVLDRGVEDSNLSMTLYTSNLDVWASTAATILTSELESLGVSVNWKKTDEPVTDVCTGDTAWDMCLTGWNNSHSAVLAAASIEERIRALSGWHSDSYDSILTQMRSAGDIALTRSFSAQLQQLIYDDCPCIVLSYGVDVQAVRNDLWTGYEDVLETAGGLFGIGTYSVYMNIAPAEGEG